MDIISLGKINPHSIVTVATDKILRHERLRKLEADLTQGYGFYYVEDADRPHWLNSYVEVFETRGELVATRWANILRAAGVELPNYIMIRSFRDGTQSLHHTVFTGPDQRRAELYFTGRISEDWGGKPVYNAVLEKRCPISKEWFTPEEDYQIFGVYSDAYEIEELVLEAAEIHWDLDSKPLSSTGKQLQRRKELKAKLKAALYEFEITAADGYPRSMEASARNVFDIHGKIEAQLLTELEELR